MAYVGNVVAFLKACVDSDRQYGLFNYVDTPDLDMNTLVRQVYRILSNKDWVGPRLPYWMGLVLGMLPMGSRGLRARRCQSVRSGFVSFAPRQHSPLPSRS